MDILSIKYKGFPKKDTFSIDLMNIEIVNSQSLSSSFPSLRQEKWEQLSLCVSIERLLINCSSANSDISNILTNYIFLSVV